MQKNKKFFFLIFLCFCGSLLAQNQINSPYSRFGIGDLQSNILSEYTAIGGSSIGSYNPNTVNPYNPASYSAFKPNSFLFSTGVMHQTAKMKTSNLQQNTNYSSFSHLVLGFPITQNIGASFGLLPYSSVGYVLEDDTLVNGNQINFNYFGEGGFNKLYFGLAYQFTESLSVGVNANYLFGKINRNRQVIFSDESFNARTNSSIAAKGFFYQLGVLYDKKVNESTDLTLGFSASNNTEISAKQTVLTETYNIVSSAFEAIKDTAENTSSGYTNSITLPQSYAIGLSVDFEKKWLLLADYSSQSWSEYRIFGETDGLTNSLTFSAGVQYTPDFDAVNNYWRLIKVRFGGKFEKTYLQIEGVQLNEKSVSIGVGLPLRKTKSTINLSAEIGERGTTERNLIKEQFLRFQIGLSLSDIWFVKRKYD